MTPEIIEASKAISKSQKKKMEQLELKKEKDAKRDHYISVLNEHQISDNHRQLLTSSKSLGQSLTLKASLKKALKRHKEGLPITDAEMDLLFPGRLNGESEPISTDVDLSISATSSVINKDVRFNSKDVLAFATSQQMSISDNFMYGTSTFDLKDADRNPELDSNMQNDIAPLIDFDELLAVDGNTDSTVKSDKKKKRKKSKQGDSQGGNTEIAGEVNVDYSQQRVNKSLSQSNEGTAEVDTASVGAIKGSLGSSLMQQLQKFKLKAMSSQGVGLSTVNSSTVAGLNTLANKDISVTDDALMPEENREVVECDTTETTSGNEKTLPVYVPICLDEAVGPDGRVMMGALDGRGSSGSSTGGVEDEGVMMESGVVKKKKLLGR